MTFSISLKKNLDKNEFSFSWTRRLASSTNSVPVVVRWALYDRPVSGRVNNGIWSRKAHWVCQFASLPVCQFDDNIFRHNARDQVWIFVADRWDESSMLSIYGLLAPTTSSRPDWAFSRSKISLWTCLRDTQKNISLNQVLLLCAQKQKHGYCFISVLWRIIHVKHWTDEKLMCIGREETVWHS